MPRGSSKLARLFRTLGNQINTVSSEFWTEPEILSAPLGIVVIDQIHLPLRPPFMDVFGSLGCYGMDICSSISFGVLKTFLSQSVTLGSRLIVGSTGSQNVRSLILAGNDLSAAIEG